MSTAIIPVEHVHRGDRITLPAAPDRAFTVESNHRIGIATNRVALHDGSRIRFIELHPGTEITLTGWEDTP